MHGGGVMDPLHCGCCSKEHQAARDKHPVKSQSNIKITSKVNQNENPKEHKSYGGK
jgi:hypothetical protein